MAGSQVSKTVAINWFIAGTYGYEAVTIDEKLTDNEPEVQGGSRLEINGDLYLFSSAESITGWSAVSDGTQAYIKFVPAGTSCTVEFTTTAPTWSDSKQGWYGTGGAANDRYLYAVYRIDTSTYAHKQKLQGRSTGTTVGTKVLSFTSTTGVASTSVDFTVYEPGVYYCDGVSNITGGSCYVYIQTKYNSLYDGETISSTLSNKLLSNFTTLSTVRVINTAILTPGIYRVYAAAATGTADITLYRIGGLTNDG